MFCREVAFSLALASRSPLAVENCEACSTAAPAHEWGSGLAALTFSCSYTGAPAATTVDVPERLDGVWRAGQHQVPARPDAAFMQAQWDRFGLRPVVIYASDLLATPAGRVLVSRMHEDAPACLAALA